jgi:hypothetical protein
MNRAEIGRRFDPMSPLANRGTGIDARCSR